MTSYLQFVRRLSTAVVLWLVAGCTGGSSGTPAVPAPRSDAGRVLNREADVPAEATAVALAEPMIQPEAAKLAGLLPLRSLGVDTFRLRHPEYDGRGVLIGILDSGLDVGVPGLAETTTGQPKILDVRDFSGEGRIQLEQLDPPSSDTVVVDGRLLTGFGRVARLASRPYFGGTFSEQPLGKLPASDVNGNGRNSDDFPVLVARSSSGWFVMTDTDLDGSLEDEQPVRDYAEGGETFTYRPFAGSRRLGPMTIAVNLAEERGRPVLDFVFDNLGHGTHVAGVAAGHSLFGVDGFDGVAPGAQLLGVKVSNNARGGMSVTGSMLRAMNYAANYAQRHGLPLVLNLSYGVGNEVEGTASIDSLVDEFALKHPEVLVVISAGNDGPGISTIGFPGSAEYALSVCALFPGAFAALLRQGGEPFRDEVASFSSRGGEVAKPDVCAPGWAFSNVPPWNNGRELEAGTSFAAPQVAGLAALLQSALTQRGRVARAVDLTRALTNTATVPYGASVLDAGAGTPDAEAAYRWLMAAHQAGVYTVKALADGGNESLGPAAYRRSGLASAGDTLQRFLVTSVGGQPAARLLLESDAGWLRAPAMVEPAGEPTTIPVTYDARLLSEPGLYVGRVQAIPATDTMAGASFTLLNTIAVPHTLARPLGFSGELDAGEVARFFFDVPAGASGLGVDFRVSRTVGGTALHLFEPSGQPHRAQRSVMAGGDDPDFVSLLISTEDLVRGVYEAVVTAPPADRTSYSLTVALPSLTIADLSDGPVAAVQNTGTTLVRAEISGRLLGAEMMRTAGGVRSEPYVVRLAQPAWADEMVIDVALPVPFWSLITDFGMTVFDSLGTKLADSPLNYAFGRQAIGLDSLDYGGELVIELLPAFAHLDAEPNWEGQLRVAFVRSDPIALALADSAPSSYDIASGETIRVRFEPTPPDSAGAPGFDPLVEVIARPGSGIPVVRRAAVRLDAPTSPSNR